MRNRKKDMIQFLEWMRNGIAFCTTWLFLLVFVLRYTEDIACGRRNFIHRHYRNTRKKVCILFLLLLLSGELFLGYIYPRYRF